MRLIDADAFFNEFPELRDYEEYALQEYKVKAIPVEWVADLIRKLARKLAEINGLDYDAIEKMVDDREKENAND